jgi:hypothetical protein
MAMTHCEIMASNGALASEEKFHYQQMAKMLWQSRNKRLSGCLDWAKYRRMGDCLLWPVYFRSSLHFGIPFSTVSIMYALILTKMYWATYLGDFFTNSSGHPDAYPVSRLTRAEAGRPELPRAGTFLFRFPCYNYILRYNSILKMRAFALSPVI